MPEQREKTVYYKRAMMGPEAAVETLSQALWRALQDRRTIGSRRQKLGQSEAFSEWLVIGHFTGNADAVSCALMRYTPGTAAAAFLDDLDAAQVQLSPVQAPSEGELRREFVEGMLLVVVSGDHVALMQSSSVRERTLENHLHWLLQSTGVLGDGQSITLDDKPTAAAVTAAEQSPVRFIELISDFGVAAADSAQAQVTRGAFDAFLALVEPDTDLPLDQLDTSKMGVTVQFRYEGRRHETPGAALDRLARVLRHADGVNLRVRLDNGSTYENEQLRTSGKIKVQTHEGLPSLLDSYQAMRAWLIQRVRE